MENQVPYIPQHKLRILTAASLFDGHDAAINIMRRIMQSLGAEVIHLGHNRSAQEIVRAAIQEDVQAIALTSYQGGHNEFFKYIFDLLREKDCGHIRIFGGGGGTILPDEIAHLHHYGITRIYSPDDGRQMGLQGMIYDLFQKSDFDTSTAINGQWEEIKSGDHRLLSRILTAIENETTESQLHLQKLQDMAAAHKVPVIGITGTGGAGKSSVIDELVRRFLLYYPTKKIGIISVDPSKRKTGGALLGDRIRMNAIDTDRVYMRSLATRQSNLALSRHIHPALNALRAAAFDLIILETSGIGQSDTEIVEHSDIKMYVMTPEYGAASQLEKIDMLDFADLIALNKFDKRGALDALRDIKKQYQRNHQLWSIDPDDMPVYGTIAAQFNDPGINNLYAALIKKINRYLDQSLAGSLHEVKEESEKIFIIPPNRVRYLSEIAENNRKYDEWVEKQATLAHQLYALRTTAKLLTGAEAISEVAHTEQRINDKIDAEVKILLQKWEEHKQNYCQGEFVYEVRGKKLAIENFTTTLSGLAIPKIAVPPYEAYGEIVRWAMQENFPGLFPYTAGVFPFKREGEDPTRMFAGEGGPERTNKRFHYLSIDSEAKRLSTAFDSVTLYGEDPGYRPDIYGKIGNSGVSICCLDDAKKLYSGFDLCHPATSVSMTINGPAAILTAFFMNAAIDQQCERYLQQNKLAIQNLSGVQYNEALPTGNDGLGLKLLGMTGDQVLPPEIYKKIKSETLAAVRGTVQADILKEDQAQNTCIFSTEFSLKLMGDMQAYFIENNVRNFYSVSISGYHIAEAGANPITQLAFTLANGFTYVEYYLSRGMKIDDFAPNLSFFFSNGVDPEYAVIGRVARRIWAKAMKYLYRANERSQKLKYHIQTSGRSLHAQEIAFNDIRTTLQALYAIYDNCNSLHTNAYDEAITTPTEESVRRAVAIQMIINKELGMSKNQNPLSGSFIIEELTNLVEEAVLAEFDRITERGGVLGAMETMYQRGKIQEESLHYEMMKHTGEYPIIGVNTFLSRDGSPTIIPKEVIRSTDEEKQNQIHTLSQLHHRHQDKSREILRTLQEDVIHNKNVFASLMEAAKYCSLGQITHALYEVGGQYRRGM